MFTEFWIHIYTNMWNLLWLYITDSIYWPTHTCLHIYLRVDTILSSNTPLNTQIFPHKNSQTFALLLMNNNMEQPTASLAILELFPVICSTGLSSLSHWKQNSQLDVELAYATIIEPPDSRSAKRPTRDSFFIQVTNNNNGVWVLHAKPCKWLLTTV